MLNTNRILVGDCRTTLRSLPDKSIHTCITSPPYFGLRDYGVDGQIGLEQTPDAFIAELVAVFREVHRVLRDDGTLWLNLGDGYSKDKNRLLIPARSAIALTQDGWVLRDEIVWHKPRTTPAPVVDRTCAAHEMIYMFSKQPRYFYEWAAIEEPSITAGKVVRYTGGQKNIGHQNRQYPGSDGMPKEIVVRDTRRKRSVWSVSPSPFKGSHFATFPPDLIEPCVLAGCPVGGTVLDPFFGAGTTGLVAQRHDRKFVGCELNPEYAEIARKRLQEDPESDDLLGPPPLNVINMIPTVQSELLGLL